MDLNLRQEELRSQKVRADLSKPLSDHDLSKSLGSAGEGAVGFENIKNYTQNLVVNKVLPDTTISCEESTKTKDCCDLEDLHDLDNLVGRNSFHPLEAIKSAANITGRDYQQTLDDIRHSNYGSAIKDAGYTAIDSVATIFSPFCQTLGIADNALSEWLDKLDRHE